MQNFRRLRVWRDAHTLALDVYQATGGMPAAERFGLQGQLRRAAVSVVANIAEGSARATDRDFARFLQNATSSAAEVDALLRLARDLQFLEPDTAAQLLSDVASVRRRLIKLLARLRAHP